MIRLHPYRLILLGALSLAGCTGMKNISSRNPLYVGHEIHFTDTKSANKKLTPIVKSVLRPLPNNTFLWMRPDVARYNMLSEKAKKKKFWKNKIAAPVLLSQTNPLQVSAAIQNRMFHQGYFQNTVTYDTVRVGNRKAKYKYTITLREPYRYETIIFPKPTNDLAQKIAATQSGSLLKAGDIYTLEAVKNERIRIDKNLKELGYIYFNPEFITIKADSVSGDHQVKTEVFVKPETPPESRKPYTVGRVFNHDGNVLDNPVTDTLKAGEYYLISQQKSLELSALQQGIFLKPGELYSHSNYSQTIRYLNELP